MTLWPILTTSFDATAEPDLERLMKSMVWARAELDARGGAHACVLPATIPSSSGYLVSYVWMLYAEIEAVGLCVQLKDIRRNIQLRE